MTIADGEYFVRRSQHDIETLIDHLYKESQDRKYTEGERNIVRFCIATIKRDMAFLMEAKITGGSV